MRQPGSRSRLLLLVAAMMAIAATWSSSEARARWFPVNRGAEKLCYYGSGVYSLGSCLNGQECKHGSDGDYWASVSDSAEYCGTQTSPGAGGKPQI